MTLGAPARLDAHAVIDLAERAQALSPGRWSLALLARAYPGVDEAALLALPLGTRDRLVLAVAVGLLGGALRAEPGCAECGAICEVTLDPVSLGLAGGAPWPDPGPRGVTVAGREVRIRPVTLADILAVDHLADSGAAAEALAGRVAEAAEVSSEALAEALEALDPGADVWLAIACPDCGAEQSIAFDPVYFLAHELRRRARQVLRDVADIARVFHWSEADILALPPSRRAFYLSEALA